MPSDDLEYYRIRERQELLAADNSSDDYCRTLHLDLARLYGMRVSELETNAIGVADDDDGYPDPLGSPFVA